MGDIMEDIIIQSAMTEIAMWDAFHTGRTANATGLLALVIAFWVAARFSSVSMDKGTNLLGKVIVTTFAVSVFMFSMIVFTNIGNLFEGQAAALAALDAANGDVDLSPAAQAYLANQDAGNGFGIAMALMMSVSALAIAVLPMWFNTND
tara:strand:- start:316 stop:762 length:447 start_codon:yes stop_codon:yes gene_type:complete